MDKLERKYGKYAIHDLSLMLIMCYVAGYIIQVIASDFFTYLTLDPYKILHGQIWRLVTWIVIPPSNLNFFTLIMLLFYYSVGTSLEKTWGAFKYNLYLFSGMIFTIVGSFVAMGVVYYFYGDALVNKEFTELLFMSGSLFFSTYFINMSILLPFAATFPDSQVYLMFVIPVKMKWLGILYAAMLIIQVVDGVGNILLSNIFYRTAVISSMMNFIVFFLLSRKTFRKSNVTYFRRKF